MISSTDKLWLALFALDCARVGCFAFAMTRVASIFPQWSAACEEGAGRSWWALFFDTKSGDGSAHPGRMVILGGAALIQAMMGLSMWINGDAASIIAKWTVATPGSLATTLLIESVYVAMFSILPAWCVATAARDRTSAIGARLADHLDRKNAPRDAVLQRQELSGEIPDPELGHPPPRL